MVIGAFPVAKLGVLAVKQISKPIAEVIKRRAKSHHFFRHYICMPPAQLYNWIEVKTKMWALNLGRPVTVPPLNEAMAIELGANLLGEFIIFTIGAGTLLLEYSRQVKKEAKKEERQNLEKAELAAHLAEMSFRLERQDAQLMELTRVVSELESRSLFRWTRERLNEYQPFNAEHPNQKPTPSAHHRSSDYNPQGGRIMKALHFLQTEVFYTHKKERGSIKKKSRESMSRNNWNQMQYMEDYDPIVIHKQCTKLKDGN